MAKASLVGGWKPFVQGETRAVRLRKAHNEIHSEKLRARLGYAAGVLRGNSIAKSCGSRMEKEFGTVHGPARGVAMRSCLRGEAYAQVGAKLASRA